jgi:CRP/FNR family transcriptional regulator, cyclic AMP receptor protein
MDLLGLNTFGSLRRRIARHLLLVAALTDGELVPLKQQQLADAVGTIRESVARVLGQFQRQGLVQRTPAGLIVTNAERLAIAAGGQGSEPGTPLRSRGQSSSR